MKHAANVIFIGSTASLFWSTCFDRHDGRLIRVVSLPAYKIWWSVVLGQKMVLQKINFAMDIIGWCIAGNKINLTFFLSLCCLAYCCTGFQFDQHQWSILIKQKMLVVVEQCILCLTFVRIFSHSVYLAFYLSNRWIKFLKFIRNVITITSLLCVSF